MGNIRLKAGWMTGAKGNIRLKNGGKTWDHGEPKAEGWFDDRGPRGT